VPKLTNMPIETALKRCEEYYLIPIIEEVDSEIEKGTVLEQSIESGEPVDKNTEITLKVSTGIIPEKIINIRVPIPASAEGEFEFKYYIDGLLDTERGEEIRDVALVADKGIAYELKGRDGDVKEFVVKVTSTLTGRSATYMIINFNFAVGDGENTYDIIERNSDVFKELLAEGGESDVVDGGESDPLEGETSEAGETSESTESTPEGEQPEAGTESDVPTE